MSRHIGFQIIVGIDFGTAYTKVMLRNAVTGELVALGFRFCGEEEYLLPSVLYLEGDQLVHPLGALRVEGLKVVPYLKMALAEKCRSGSRNWSRLIESCNGDKLSYCLEDCIEALVSCYLAQVVQNALQFIRGRWPDFGVHQDDKTYFQMSLPVQDAQQESLLRQFKKCLCWAVAKAEGEAQEQDLLAIQQSVERQPLREDCFFLAEVTANVLTYRSSRAGRPGVYLFVDVGAGTVDLSVFHYPDSAVFEEVQNYAAAKVSPTGSGHIEMRALETCSVVDRAIWLAKLRACKEGSVPSSELSRTIQWAKTSLFDQLHKDILGTLESARHKFVSNEFKTLTILAGGGGWCVTPYFKAAVSAVRKVGIEPRITPLPAPENAEELWGMKSRKLAPRFSVAHGLSHPFWTWPAENYPHQLSNLAPQRRTFRRINPAHEPDS